MSAAGGPGGRTGDVLGGGVRESGDRHELLRLIGGQRIPSDRRYCDAVNRLVAYCQGVLALTLPDAQVMVVLPRATPVASPLPLMVAMLVEVDVHVTELVAFPVVLLP